jgi:hypothetical protein
LEVEKKSVWFEDKSSELKRERRKEGRKEGRKGKESNEGRTRIKEWEGKE